MKSQFPGNWKQIPGNWKQWQQGGMGGGGEQGLLQLGGFRTFKVCHGKKDCSENGAWKLTGNKWKASSWRRIRETTRLQLLMKMEWKVNEAMLRQSQTRLVPSALLGELLSGKRKPQQGHVQ